MEEEEEEGAVRRKKKDRRSEGIIDILVFSSIWRCFAKRFTKIALALPPSKTLFVELKLGRAK